MRHTVLWERRQEGGQKVSLKATCPQGLLLTAISGFVLRSDTLPYITARSTSEQVKTCHIIQRGDRASAVIVRQMIIGNEFNGTPTATEACQMWAFKMLQKQKGSPTTKYDRNGDMFSFSS